MVCFLQRLLKSHCSSSSTWDSAAAGGFDSHIRNVKHVHLQKNLCKRLSKLSFYLLCAICMELILVTVAFNYSLNTQNISEDWVALSKTITHAAKMFM